MNKLSLLIILLITSFSSSAVITKGTISILRSPSYETGSIYFKLDSMPSGVTKWFFAVSTTNVSAGCTRQGNTESLNRTYSMLLAAKTSNKKVTVDYCLDSNGYGAVRFVQME
ncbi:hypothetical protein [Aliivibrio kagoshimensis]|uniref:hypothetical protein n=1 Tax=Aliivibrio kagoshimensis TaxID=2910230 RepID=UPI003D13B8F2